MKTGLLYFICFICLGCKAQSEKTGPKADLLKIDRLYAEVLTNLALRKDNIQKNGPKICTPRLSNDGFLYLPDFLKEGGLNELPNPSEWFFIKDYLNSANLKSKSFDKASVKKILKARDVELTENSGLRTGFTRPILNKKEDMACLIYFDFFSNSPGTGVIANKIIAFYKYANNRWIKVATLPLALE